MVDCSRSEIPLSSSSDPRTKDRRRDRRINHIKRIHDALDPGLIDLEHELPHRLLGLRTAGIAGQQSSLPRRRGRRSGGVGAGIVGVGRRARVRVHEQEELDVAAGQEAVDVIVLEAVDVFEVADAFVNERLDMR